MDNIRIQSIPLGLGSISMCIFRINRFIKGSGNDNLIDLDDEKFWNWFKNDYRDMLKRIPEVDGLVLTFVETGIRAERQKSEVLKTGAEKIAAVVNHLAEVVCDEFDKKIYLRTFAYSNKEYDNLIGCISHIRKDDRIVLMMKETPHDFFLTHPNDYYAGTIDRPTIIEFDTCGEFHGQGITAGTWVEYILERWSDFIKRPNIIGYTARTDRYGNTHMVGTPNEILLYALKRYTEDPTLTADLIYDEFITQHYGAETVEILKPAFKSAFDIATSSFYVLGTNMANHSRMDFAYKSNFLRHVSGRWLSPPEVFVEHNVNRHFHYWTDIIEQLAPAEHKIYKGRIAEEAEDVIANAWVTPTEQMTEEMLQYVTTEKAYAIELAQKALIQISSAKNILKEEDYKQIYELFERTLFTARIHEAAATAYWSNRIYARGDEFRTESLIATREKALVNLLRCIDEMNAYPNEVPAGQWDWFSDIDAAQDLYDMVINTK